MDQPQFERPEARLTEREQRLLAERRLRERLTTDRSGNGIASRFPSQTLDTVPRKGF